ncbi:MAG: hypothetical protein K8I30_09095 [Anaerolineae bacterium]|nr:hypothetical protein [Anaerolineae bacterium]
MSRKYWIAAVAGGVLVVIVAVLLLVNQAGLSVPDDGLVRIFNNSPTGFTIRYPDGWQSIIPMTGLVVFGAPDTLNNVEPGPTFTVQRTDPLSVYGTLNEALDLYLRRGPLRPDRSWKPLGEITQMTFAGRDALSVNIQGRENDVSPEMRAHIVATTAQNTFVYILVLTAPAEDWGVDEPTLTAMLNSLQMLE